MRRIGILLGILLLLTVTSIAFAQGVSREERAEIRFLEGMIDHHQMALDMAEHCLEVADTEALSDICQAVIHAQTPEIEQMQAWLLEWYNIAYMPTSMLHQSHEPEPIMPTGADQSGMMGMMGGMSDMMSQMSNMMGMMGGSGMMDGMGMMQGRDDGHDAEHVRNDDPYAQHDGDDGRHWHDERNGHDAEWHEPG
ncbi:MAG: DUF305 domain-containing protein [Chloroflexi bacterium]|nr:DUF305 domain-containing protein [Chloroflexota bacterium]